MGLEIVEFLMQIEEKLDINIPDEDSNHLLTVGSLCEYIVNKKKAQGEIIHINEVFQRVKKIIDETGYAEDNIIEMESRFIEDLGFD